MRSLSLVRSLPSPNVEVNHLRWLTHTQTRKQGCWHWWDGWLVYWSHQDLVVLIEKSNLNDIHQGERVGRPLSREIPLKALSLPRPPPAHSHARPPLPVPRQNHLCRPVASYSDALIKSSQVTRTRRLQIQIWLKLVLIKFFSEIETAVPLTFPPSSNS